MVERARTIADGISMPLIADADTGFGGLISVRQTVRGYEAAGVQAIQIEDQEMPKKCGHTPNRRVIPSADMRRKVEVAIEARRTPETLIIARTDARTGLGLDEAIRRGREYAKAGADIVFVEALESEDEFKRVGEEGRLLAACQHGADRQFAGGAVRQSPNPTASTSRSIHRPACRSCARRSTRTTATSRATVRRRVRQCPAYTMAQLHELTGFPEVWEFEGRFAEV